MFSLAVGVMAHNEEANIERLMRSLQSQRLQGGVIREIVVTASGCTDGTVDIVRRIMDEDARIRLLIQARREGKASAINLFLAHASADICMLVSADTLPQEGALEALLDPFSDLDVGMTGARPVPTNSRDCFMGFAAHLMWSLHHRISLVSPKMGEMVAFRGFVKEIPLDTAVDEASIESIVKAAGYEVRYAPDAIVLNRGPENVRDFITQRRRIAAGHAHLARSRNYRVSTLRGLTILSLLLTEHRHSTREVMWTLGVVGLEVLGRLLGYFDLFVRKKNPVVWEIASSTKKLD